MFCSLKALEQLEVLNLRDNNFSKDFPHVVENITSLKELHLDSCSLAGLPEGYVLLYSKLPFFYIQLMIVGQEIKT